MKILVTGDREWTDIETVYAVLSQFPAGTILIHGECRGADIICKAVGESLGFVVRGYEAEWGKLPPGVPYKAAGPIRNQHMLDVEHLPDEPIDFCFGFHNNISSSRGTKDMMKRAEKAKITTSLITSLATPS